MPNVSVSVVSVLKFIIHHDQSLLVCVNHHWWPPQPVTLSVSVIPINKCWCKSHIVILSQWSLCESLTRETLGIHSDRPNHCPARWHDWVVSSVNSFCWGKDVTWPLCCTNCDHPLFTCEEKMSAATGSFLPIWYCSRLMLCMWCSSVNGRETVLALEAMQKLPRLFHVRFCRHLHFFSTGVRSSSATPWWPEEAVHPPRSGLGWRRPTWTLLFWRVLWWIFLTFACPLHLLYIARSFFSLFRKLSFSLSLSLYLLWHTNISKFLTDYIMMTSPHSFAHIMMTSPHSFAHITSIHNP